MNHICMHACALELRTYVLTGCTVSRKTSVHAFDHLPEFIKRRCRPPSRQEQGREEEEDEEMEIPLETMTRAV
jgi:hypothetical protein